MSAVVSFRIPRELKEKMHELREFVNWSEEVRKFLEEKVKEYSRKKALRDVRAVIESLPEVLRGTVTKYVREDRDSN